MIDIKNSPDLMLAIATGKSKQEKKWKNTSISWKDLVNKLSKTTRTFETVDEFKAMGKERQDTIKDVGGFVGGELKEGRRKNGYVMSRSIVTLDIDFGSPSLWDDIELLTEYAMLCYSTHKHTPKKPRLRLIIPLNRKVDSDEYEAIARKLADEIGMDYFDDTTYEPTRLMFWPSTPKDGEYFFRVIDNPVIDADEILAKYTNWKDTSFWPESSRARSNRKSLADKQGDPLAKDGIIGLFCRTYSIQEAIAKFIPDEYIEAQNGRYTYAKGSTSGGLVVYDDKFAYSNHGTDPTGGQLCNAFDLVRIHKFGSLDIDVKEELAVTKRPSYKAMMDFAITIDEIKQASIDEKMIQATADFASASDELEIGDTVLTLDDKEWMKKLTINKANQVESTLQNMITILNNDNNLRGIGGKDLFSGRLIVKRDLPWKRYTETWTDSDDVGFRVYMECVYGIEGRQKLQDAIDNVFTTNAYHPVKNYLNSVKWDGIPRVESLLIDYLGAEDNDYVRAVTRKTLVAAVARIFDPGCKFDSMLTLVGPQGIGKSMIFNVLGGEWFSDTLVDITGKGAYEALDGVWIMEMSELSALKKQERESIKSYVSKQVDTYRKAYERNTTVNPRQCIFIGTTNDKEFLNDPTGGRRFWVVDTNPDKRTKTVWNDLTPKTRDLIWAEAVELYMLGENINELPEEVLNKAVAIQREHSENNALLGIIEEFLEKKIPSNWTDMGFQERVNWMHATEDYASNSNLKMKERTFISAIEVWCECLFKDKAFMTNKDAKLINECIDGIPGWTRCKTPKKVNGYGSQRGFIKEH